MESRGTEERILEAAFKVVDQYTISGTRMHLIAEEAKMVQSNLHYYFKTKQDLMLGLLKYLQNYFSTKRQIILEEEANTLEGQIGGFFRQKKDIILNTPEYDRVQIDFWSLSQVDEKYKESFLVFFDTWRQHIFEVLKLYESEVEEEKCWMTACVMLSMMMGATLQYLNSNEVFDLDNYFEVCMEMIMKYMEP